MPASQTVERFDATVREGAWCRSRKASLGACRVIGFSLGADLLGAFNSEEEQLGAITVLPNDGFGPVDLPLWAWKTQGWRITGAPPPNTDQSECKARDCENPVDGRALYCSAPCKGRAYYYGWHR